MAITFSKSFIDKYLNFAISKDNNIKIKLWQ